MSTDLLDEWQKRSSERQKLHSVRSMLMLQYQDQLSKLDPDRPADAWWQHCYTDLPTEGSVIQYLTVLQNRAQKIRHAKHKSDLTSLLVDPLKEIRELAAIRFELLDLEAQIERI